MSDWIAEPRILESTGKEIGQGSPVTSKQGEGKVLRVFGRAPKVAVRVDQLGPNAAPLYFDCREPEAFVYVCDDLTAIGGEGE
jgi:hypothetical protein